jgi:agmatinase
MSDIISYQFLGASGTARQKCPALLGCPYDGTASFRPGARFGPQAIRQASAGLETYSPDLDMDIEDGDVEDGGDLGLPFGDREAALNTVRANVATILDNGRIPFLLGGEHTVSIPAVSEVSARYDGLKVIQLDAHLDLRQQYLQETVCHATVMRRISEVVGSENVRQLGVRSGTRDEWQLAKEWGTVADQDFDIARWIGETPAYLTVDLDVFDPGVMGGTGTPEPGGWTYGDFVSFLRGIFPVHWVGVDVVELSPHYDPSGASSVLAAKVVRDLILVLAAGNR